MSKPEALLVFGDSLSDSGNAYDLSGRVLKVPIPPESAGYNGWFSNGLIQSGVTADLLGVPRPRTTPSAAPGRSGRARSRSISRRTTSTRRRSCWRTRTRWRSPPTPTSAGSSSGISLDAATNPPADGTAAAIWIGANDYNALLPDAPPELVLQTIAAVVGNTIAGGGGDRARPGSSGSCIYNLPAPEFLPLPLPPEFARWSTRTTPRSPQGWRSWRARGSTRRSSTCTASAARSSPTRAPSG